MKTPLRKLRVSDEEYARWKAAAPGGNVSAWLRGLAADALAWPGEQSAPALPAAATSRAREAVPAGSEAVATPESADVQRVEHSDRQRVAGLLDVPAVIVGDPTPDDFVRREAALLASLNPKE